MSLLIHGHCAHCHYRDTWNSRLCARCTRDTPPGTPREIAEVELGRPLTPDEVEWLAGIERDYFG